jgi:APA family basic amino acid/polyamine antiporter
MENGKKLVKGLGFIALVASCFNCTVGGGIFRLPSSVYALTGNLSPVVYFVCFLVMLFVAGVFIQVGRTIKTSGGPYAYVKPILGNYSGFICGVLLWSLATFAFASVANAYAHFVAQLIPGAETPAIEALILAITLSLLAYLNTWGVKSGAGASMILAMIKITPLLFLVAVGVPHLNSEALALPSTIEGETIARGAMLLIFAFTGIETALIPSGEIESPEKNLSKALITSSFIVLILYLCVHGVSQSVLGAKLGEEGIAPLSLTANAILGPSGAMIMTIGAVFSTLGYLSAVTLSLPRSLFAFAEDGYLPKSLAKVSDRTLAPVNAIWVQVIIVFIMATNSQFEKLAILANLSAILMYLICAIAALILMKKSQKLNLTSTAIPVIAMAMMSYLLTSVTAVEWLSVGALLAASSVLYWRKSRNPQST